MATFKDVAIFIMSTKWNFEVCSSLAKNFETKRDFRAKENLAYQWLLRNRLLDAACAHMRPLVRRLTDDDIAVIAANYSTRKAFENGDRGAYSVAFRRGLLDKVCAHMELSPRYSYVRWTRQSVLQEAAKYKNRAEFKRSNAGAYEFALSNKMLSQACAHMRDGNGFWHVFELMAVAIKYIDWSEFIKSEPQAYNWANKNKLTDIASAHMAKRREWDKQSVMAEAAKYKTRSMFFSMASGAYKHAIASSYADEVFAHMDNMRGIDWDKSKVISEAAKYETRTAFQSAEAGAYYHAIRNGYIDEACAHMEPGATGFCCDKPANLYHLRITAPGGITIYKIGITNRAVERRIAGMGLHKGVSAEVLDVIHFDSGRDARITEKLLHRQNAAHRYNGEPVMKNGNTELFTVQIID